MDVRDLSPADAHRLQRAGALLVDVRSPAERAGGMASGAVGIELEDLERAPDGHLPDHGAQIILICQRGTRSARLGVHLCARGYERVASVAGGTGRWIDDGLPMAPPDGPEDADFHARYARHLSLTEIGVDGQRRLESARVVIVGAGGLGSPAAFYLAAAGVGHIRIADDDRVDRSNLQRQILHTDAGVGTPKVESAQARLQSLNPRIEVEAMQERMSAANVERLLAGADVVVDGTDNFPTRYLLNDACVHLALPLVHGAVHRFEGQVSVFDAGRHRGSAPCYRCLFPEAPPPGTAPNCGEAGVLGVLPGVIGMLQATEAVKLILGIGQPLRGRLLQFDALAARFREIALPVDPDCPVCAPGRPIHGFVEEAAQCAGDDREGKDVGARSFG